MITPVSAPPGCTGTRRPLERAEFKNGVLSIPKGIERFTLSGITNRLG